MTIGSVGFSFLMYTMQILDVISVGGLIHSYQYMLFYIMQFIVDYFIFRSFSFCFYGISMTMQTYKT